MPTCVDGHESVATDYCDVCGAVMGAATVPSAASAPDHLRRKLETDPSRPRHLITESGMGAWYPGGAPRRRYRRELRRHACPTAAR